MAGIRTSTVLHRDGTDAPVKERPVRPSYAFLCDLRAQLRPREHEARQEQRETKQ
ncbi:MULTISPECIES: hypothetical protein [Streptomyces]|uniref:hypothetical protein n=1 Tax=Streptomyces TaxID=1883 RepID=UPI0015C4F6DA|nr:MULTISPECIES: hypothetical protein [Streptomyces]MDX3637094.1 hypothetical protein [Streptomyces europaeiscabiei]MDX3655238.1 hypothetical protein [Streptomyces europaeiscabiei]WRZ53661.1 hypothetical protein OG622_45700 [Streptomyces sp. NBC_01314]